MFLEALKKMATQDWWLLIILGAWSLAGLTIVLERLHFLWDVLPRSEDFKDKVLAALERGERQAASALCEASTVPLAQVFARGFDVARRQPDSVPEAVALRRTAVVQGLKRYLWALGTISSSAPFVGLFGTVVGIMDAFASMGRAGTGGFKVVSAGISSALIATALGLGIAILAVVMYNYFTSRINEVSLAYKVFTEEFVLALCGPSSARGHEAPRTEPAARAAAAAEG
jgi:biopolymer transport protein ExbB/TolQ